MAKLTTNTIAGAYASTTELNDNFALVEAAIEKCLFLDGTTPNTMSADIDLNNQDLLNGGTVTATSIILNGTVITSTGTAAAADASAIAYTPVGGSGLTTVADALDDDFIRDDQNGTIAGTLTATGFDGILGAVTPAAATVTTLAATGDFTYDSIVQPKVKIIDIGDWNMDSTVSVNVAHGLTLANIRTVQILIRNDTDASYYSLEGIHTSGGAVEGYFNLSATNVTAVRVTSGFFDTTAFDSTTYNRGWITITYV
jgi:hypothetical protein